MKKLLLALSLCLATSCGDDAAPGNPPDAGLPDTGLPDAEPPSPPAREDGEYSVRVETKVYVCGSESKSYDPWPDIVSAVAHDDPRSFDLVPSYHSAAAMYAIPRRDDGGFDLTIGYQAWFFDYIWIKVRNVGHLTEADLDVYTTFEIYLYQQNGELEPEPYCHMEYAAKGKRRHRSWNGTHRRSRDGQWSAQRTVVAAKETASAKLLRQVSVALELPGRVDGLTVRPDGLLDLAPTEALPKLEMRGVIPSAARPDLEQPDAPGVRLPPAFGPFPQAAMTETHQAVRSGPTIDDPVVLETRSQAADDSMFDMRGTLLGIANVLLQPGDVVDVYILQSTMTTDPLYANANEIKLFGTITTDKLSLTFSWKWFNPVTGEVHLYKEEKYEGAPRFDPFDPTEASPMVGAYLARYVTTVDSCGGGAYDRNRLVEVLPMDDQVWIWASGYRREPYVRPRAGGVFDLSFERTWAWRYVYFIDDGVIDGQALGYDLTVDLFDPGVTDPEVPPVCQIAYRADGWKRYASYRSD